MKTPPSGYPLVDIPTGNTGQARQHNTLLGAPNFSSAGSDAFFKKGINTFTPIAKGIDGVAKVATAISFDVMQKEAETRAMSEYAKASADANDYLHGPNGLFTRQGENAIGVRQEAEKWFTDMERNYVKGMNPATKELFLKRIVSTRAGALDSLGSFEMKQREAAYDGALSAQIKADKRMLLSVPYGSPMYRDAMLKVLDGVQSLGERKGLTAQEMAEAKHSATSEVLKDTAMIALEQGDIAAAFSILQNGDLAIQDSMPVSRAYKDKVGELTYTGLLNAAQNGDPFEIEQQIKNGSFGGTSSQWSPAIVSAARQYGVDPEIGLSILQTESAGKADAVSHKGARGLMQIMPGTAKHIKELFGIDVTASPEENIRGGVAYFKWLKDQFGGNDYHAAYAYNWGIGNMKAYLETGKGVNGQPMPKETKDYPGKVFGRLPQNSSFLSLSPQKQSHIYSAIETNKVQTVVGQYSDMPPQEAIVAALRDSRVEKDPALAKSVMNHFDGLAAISNTAEGLLQDQKGQLMHQVLALANGGDPAKVEEAILAAPVAIQDDLRAIQQRVEKETVATNPAALVAAEQYIIASNGKADLPTLLARYGDQIALRDFSNLRALMADPNLQQFKAKERQDFDVRMLKRFPEMTDKKLKDAYGQFEAAMPYGVKDSPSERRKFFGDYLVEIAVTKEDSFFWFDSTKTVFGFEVFDAFSDGYDLPGYGVSKEMDALVKERFASVGVAPEDMPERNSKEYRDVLRTIYAGRLKEQQQTWGYR